MIFPLWKSIGIINGKKQLENQWDKTIGKANRKVTGNKTGAKARNSTGAVTLGRREGGKSGFVNRVDLGATQE